MPNQQLHLPVEGDGAASTGAADADEAIETSTPADEWR